MTSDLPDTARDLLARAGLDLTTFDIETEFARIEATHEEVRAWPSTSTPI